jgi:hypothetical protein
MTYCRCLLRDNTSRCSSALIWLSYALMMDAAGSSKTSEHYYRTTRRHIQRQRSSRSFTLSGVNRQQANRLNVVRVRFRRTGPVKLKYLFMQDNVKKYVGDRGHWAGISWRLNLRGKGFLPKKLNDKQEKKSNHIKTKKYIRLGKAKCTLSAVENHLYVDPLWTEYFI